MHFGEPLFRLVGFRVCAASQLIGRVWVQKRG